MGALENRVRARLLRLLIAFEREDPERLADALRGLGMSTTPVDRSQLTDDPRRLLGSYSGSSLGEIALGRSSTAITSNSSAKSAGTRSR